MNIECVHKKIKNLKKCVTELDKNRFIGKQRREMSLSWSNSVTYFSRFFNFL